MMLLQRPWSASCRTTYSPSRTLLVTVVAGIAADCGALGSGNTESIALNRLKKTGSGLFKPMRMYISSAVVSPFLPTRALADALSAETRGEIAWRAWLLLVVFSGAFAVFAAWGYRRDEGRRYG